MVEDSDLDTTMDKISSLHGEKLSPTIAHNIAHEDVSCGPESSLGVSTPMEGETKKAQEIPGFVALCQFLSSNSFNVSMGEEGLQLPHKTKRFLLLLEKGLPNGLLQPSNSSSLQKARFSYKLNCELK